MADAGVAGNTAIAGGSALLAGQVLTLVSPVFAHFGLALNENQENALIALASMLVAWFSHRSVSASPSAPLSAPADAPAAPPAGAST